MLDELKELTVIVAYPDLEERYQAGMKLLRAKLNQYHPDTNGDTLFNRRMTLYLLRLLAQWHNMYRRLK